MRFQVWHAPLRLATGAFILNSGINKWKSGDDEVHKNIHSMAANAYPQLEPVDAKMFTKSLAGAEMALGTALLTPFISPGLAGAALTAFSGGLVGMYLRTPGMRENGTIRPSQNGTAVAKDVWMLGIGTALVLDAITSRAKRLIPGKK